MEKLKLSDFPHLIAALEANINSGKITEVKKERGRDGNPVIALVEIKRNLIFPEK